MRTSPLSPQRGTHGSFSLTVSVSYTHGVSSRAVRSRVPRAVSRPVPDVPEPMTRSPLEASVDRVAKATPATVPRRWALPVGG